MKRAGSWLALAALLWPLDALGNGTETLGAAQDGAAQDGAAQDGAAQDGAAQDGPATFEPSVDVSGYINPRFSFRYRADAFPKDEFDYGFDGGAGLIVDAKPFEMWRGRLHLLISAKAIELVGSADDVDLNGDGVPDAIEVTTREVARQVVQEASITFAPIDQFGAKIGAMRIPFTLQQQSANTALIFASRSSANEVFLSGADVGALLYGDILDGRIVTSFGVYNGTSLGLELDNTADRGVALSFRADVNPFGAFPFGEGDHQDSPFRLGLGFGMLYKPATSFDERTGTEPHAVNDVRLAASLRMAFRGLYFAAEYFRRQATDDFTFRPQIADGAYGQLAFFFKIVNFGLEPIVRVGFTAADQSFDPRFIGYTDAGINLYPEARGDDPDRLKLSLQYVGERRFTEDEDGHGAAAALQLKF